MKTSVERIEIEVRKQDFPFLTETNPAAYHIGGGSAPWNVPQELRVSVLDRDQKMQTLPIRVAVEQGPMVLVPRYNIQRGQSLTAEDFELVSVERTNGNVLSDYSEIEGKEALSILAAGRQVSQNQVKPKVLVQRNAMVKVHARFGAVDVNTYCKALKEGSEGDVIQVEPPWKTKTRPTPITVKIIGVNEAEVLAK
ncbi:MAG: flagellar basal body P-ring formation chaperone FlgA [Planctomycetaceae bacterium]